MKNIKYFKKMSAKGNYMAKFILAEQYYDLGKSKSFKLFKELSKIDYWPAFYKLGYMYEHGNFVKQNLELAIECYTKALEFDETKSHPISYLNKKNQPNHDPIKDDVYFYNETSKIFQISAAKHLIQIYLTKKNNLSKGIELTELLIKLEKKR